MPSSKVAGLPFFIILVSEVTSNVRPGFVFSSSVNVLATLSTAPSLPANGNGLDFVIFGPSGALVWAETHVGTPSTAAASKVINVIFPSFCIIIIRRFLLSARRNTALNPVPRASPFNRRQTRSGAPAFSNEKHSFRVRFTRKSPRDSIHFLDRLHYFSFFSPSFVPVNSLVSPCAIHQQRGCFLGEVVGQQRSGLAFGAGQVGPHADCRPAFHGTVEDDLASRAFPRRDLRGHGDFIVQNGDHILRLKAQLFALIIRDHSADDDVAVLMRFKAVGSVLLQML